MNTYLNIHYVHACMCFQIANFCDNGKFSMKFDEKYNRSAEGASRKFLDMLIDHRNLL